MLIYNLIKTFVFRNEIAWSFISFISFLKQSFVNKLEVLEGPMFEVPVSLVFRLNSRVEQEQMHTPPFVRRNTLLV
jgi:hypothetical protein